MEKKFAYINSAICMFPFWQLQKPKLDFCIEAKNFSVSMSNGKNDSLSMDTCCCLFKPKNGRITIAEIEKTIGAGRKSQRANIKSALKNLAEVKYHLRNDDKHYEFTVLSKLTECGKGRSLYFEYEFSPILNEIKSHSEHISLDDYFSLSSGLPRRLFLWLEYKKYHSKEKSIEIGLDRLCSWLPVRGKYRSDKVRTLTKSLKKLVDRGFCNYEFRGDKVFLSWEDAAAFLDQEVEEEKQIPEIDQVAKETKEEPTPAIETKAEIVVDTTPNVESKENIISPTKPNFQEAAAKEEWISLGEAKRRTNISVNDLIAMVGSKEITGNKTGSKYSILVDAKFLVVEVSNCHTEVKPQTSNIQSVSKTEKAVIMEKQETPVVNVPRSVGDLSNYECAKCHDYFGFLEKGICPRCRAKKVPKWTNPMHQIDVQQALIIAQQCRKPIEITSPKQNPKKDLLDSVRERVKKKIEAAKNDKEAQKLFEEHQAKTLVDSLIKLSQREEFTKPGLTLAEKQELFWSKTQIQKPEDINFWLSSNRYNFNVSQLFHNSKFNNMEDFCNYFSRDFLKKVEGRAKKAGNGLVISLFKSGEKYELTDYEWECLDRGKHPDDDKVIPPDPEKEYKVSQQYVEEVTKTEDDKKRRQQIFIEKLSEEKDKINFDDVEQDARASGIQSTPPPLRENPDVVARYTKIAMVEILAERLSVAVPESDIYPEIIKILKTDLQLVAT